MKKFLPKSMSEFIIPTLVAIFNLLIILFPKDIIDASKNGINLWWNIIMPSLLPFVIGTNIMIGLGIVNFLGTLLEPLTYMLFGVPGAGGFAMISGMVSGYPMGARVTAMLRKKKELSATEAQRLISFANNSGPIFVIGSVGIGMFGSVKAGYFILGVHYFTAIITGMIFRYYNFSERRSYHYEKRIFSKALYEMQIAKAKDGRPFGQLMSDAIKNAMEIITQIGGFIILFSVIVKVIEITGIIDLLKNILHSLPITSHLNLDYLNGFLTGIIEVTNGAKIIASTVPGKTAIVICCAIISFGGFSIHAQTLNFISKTGIKTGIYLLSKLTHACLASVTASLTYPILNYFEPETLAVASMGQTIDSFLLLQGGFISTLSLSVLSFVCSVAVILFIALLVLGWAARRRY